MFSASILVNKSSPYCFKQDLDRVQRHAAGAVQDLVAAAGARGGNHGVFGRGTHRGKKDQLADLLRHLEVFGFVAEGTRHAAASRRDNHHLVARR